MATFPDIENPLYTLSGVPFEYLYDNYMETVTFRASNSVIRARCAWEDRDLFYWDIMGWTKGSPGDTMFQRFPPQLHPDQAMYDMYCTQAVLIGKAGSTLGTINQPSVINIGFFDTDWAVFEMTFSRLEYFVNSDTNVATRAIPELFRYCIISDKPRAREFTVNSFSLVVEADPTRYLKQPAFIIDKEQDFIITLLEVPAQLYPQDGITACLGNINDADILIPISYENNSFPAPDNYSTRNLPKDSLLLRGVASNITAYEGPGGQWFKDIPYYFTYRPNGWRKLPDPSGTGDFVTVIFDPAVIAPTKYLYDEADFTKLFKPSAT